MADASAAAAELATGFGASLVQVTLALLAVCALAVLSLWLLRRRLPTGAGPQRALRMVARLSLDPRHTLYVVEAAGRFLLVGAGDGAVSLLGELEAEKFRAPAPAPTAMPGAGAAASVDGAPRLVEAMRRILGGRAG